MINVSHPSPTSLHVALGNDSQKPSASLDFSIANDIALGAKLHIPGTWLDETRASLNPFQQKLFDYALNVLGGKEKPRSVEQTADGRTIQLDSYAHGATTLSIGFQASMSGALNFLGMRDREGRDLLTLGTRVVNAFSRPASSPGLAAPSLPPRPPQQQFRPHPLADRRSKDSAPPLPPRPVRTTPPSQQPSNIHQHQTDSAPPPLPARQARTYQQPHQRSRNARQAQTNSVPFVRPPPVGPRQPYEDQAWQPPPFGATMRASSFPDPTISGPPHYEAHVAEELARTEGQQTPRPGMTPRLSQADFEARLNGWSAPTQRQRSQSAPPRPNQSPMTGFSNAQMPADWPSASAAPPPRPPKVPLGVPPRGVKSMPETAERINRADRPRVGNDGTKPGVAQEKASPQRPEPRPSPNASAKIGASLPSQPPVKSMFLDLGLNSNAATSKEIRAAYRAYALKYHPDKNNDPGALAKFQAALSAFEVLGKEQTRNDYLAGLIDDQGRRIPPRKDKAGTPPSPNAGAPR